MIKPMILVAAGFALGYYKGLSRSTQIAVGLDKVGESISKGVESIKDSENIEKLATGISEALTANTEIKAGLTSLEKRLEEAGVIHPEPVVDDPAAVDFTGGPQDDPDLITAPKTQGE